MLSSDAIKKRLTNPTLLDLDDEQLCAELEDMIEAVTEHDHQISDMLDQLLIEVDELLLYADELEEDEPRR